MHWRFAPLGALLVAAGCASSGTVEPSRDHPASPDATSAPMPGPSATLALVAPPAPTAAASAPPTGGHDPAAHGAHGEVSSPAGQGAASYACPMHPEVVSAKPDERCPKCQMKLKAKPPAPAAPATAPAGGHEHHTHGGH